MKQKQVKASSKTAKQTKVVKTAPPTMKVEEVVESDEEELVQKKVVAKKVVTKKAAKGKKVVEPEEDESADEDVEAENDNDETEDDNEVAGEDNEEPEDDDDAEDDENEDENDDEDDDDNDDGTEEPTIPSKVKIGPIPPTIPIKKIIHVKQLPKKCKKNNIVEVFAKYGAIDQIHIVTTPSGTFANIAFKTAKAALAAINDDQKVKVGDSLVSIAKKETKNEKKELSRERSVYVRNIKEGTTEAQLRQHFESCGEIEHVKMATARVGKAPIAFVTFIKTETVPAALNLHNSILNDINIKVFEHTINRENKQYDENLTILLRNKQDIESIEVAKLQNIFSECGEVDYVDIICKRKILGFITFKTAEAAAKALKMNGQTVQDVELEMEAYCPIKKWTTIHVLNVPRGCTEEDLQTHFSKAGKIANVVVKGSFGIVRFEDSDGYCKSFLYNESFLKGNMLFIEPHSSRKAKVLQKNISQKKAYKRSFENGRGFKNKKPKLTI